MFRIRRIYDDVLPVNREVIRQAKEILRAQLAGLPPEEIEHLGDNLRNPFKQRFRSILFVAENGSHHVEGFAHVMHDPDLGFCFLNYLAAARGWTSRGVGGALYQRVRREAIDLGARGIFFECSSDEPADVPDPQLRKLRAARLRFYERYGARPIVHTAYQMPIRPTHTDMPLLVYDGLDSDGPLRRDFAQQVVRAILERKYGHVVPMGYTQAVVASFQDDPVRLRAPRHVRKAQAPPALRDGTPERSGLVVNDRHEIHHVHERGYVESPVRITSILEEIVPAGLFDRMPPREFAEKHILAVHDAGYISYFRRACAAMPPGKSLYPYTFPLRNVARPPKDLTVRAGYYCIDTFTPINRNAYLAAKRAVDCALTAARDILEGRHLAYALVRPPGHHAERRSFGGFCYFNSAAIAANYLSHHGKVAMLDIDYHHGNGQQDIFYNRADVLTLSIHGNPNIAYPYFSGFADERGEGPGEGFNVNFPLPEHLDGPQHHRVVARALRIIADFDPAFLVVCLGLDTAKLDPTGTWTLEAKDFEANGRAIGEMLLPTLVVQEGGYRTRTLGVNARHFFKGLIDGAQQRPRPQAAVRASRSQ